MLVAILGVGNIGEKTGSLAGVAKWFERWPGNLKVASLIPGWAHAWAVFQVCS